MIAGCYDLHLYCDGLGCEAGRYRQRAEIEVIHEHGATCRRRARKVGWRLFVRTGQCLCPSCVARGAEAVEL